MPGLDEANNLPNKEPAVGSSIADNKIATQKAAIDRFISDTSVPKEVQSPNSIAATLDERGKRYGEFPEHARITQNIKLAMRDSENWEALEKDMKEALEMVAHKLGRILNGDPYYMDSWHDAIGYLTLIERKYSDA